MFKLVVQTGLMFKLVECSDWLKVQTGVECLNWLNVQTG